MKRMNAVTMAGMALVVGFTGCSSKVEVPVLEGLDSKAATAALQSAGLQAGPVQGEFTGTRNSGTVLRQAPPAKTQVAKGALVYLTVEESVMTPNLVGMDSASAQRTLENLGLRLQAVDKKFVGGTLSNVVSHVPEAGKRVAPGSGVNLTLDDFVVVPDFVGQNIADVRRSIGPVRLQVGQKTLKADRKSAPGTVLEQAPEVGTKVAPSTTINFEITAAPGETPGKGTAATSNARNGTPSNPKADTADKVLDLVQNAVDLATNSNQSKEQPGSEKATGTNNTAEDKQAKTEERVRKGIGIFKGLFGRQEGK